VGGKTPFPTPTVRYAASHPEGHSLGDWAPAPTATREGITTVTIEIPQYDASVPAADKVAVEEAHRDVLRDIFLGDPAQVAANAKMREVIRDIAKQIKKGVDWLGVGN
jgi:hypothetical protein